MSDMKVNKFVEPKSMVKPYVAPVTEVFEVRMNSILCDSNEHVTDIPGTW